MNEIVLEFVQSCLLSRRAVDSPTGRSLTVFSNSVWRQNNPYNFPPYSPVLTVLNDNEQHNPASSEDSLLDVLVYKGHF